MYTIVWIILGLFFVGVLTGGGSDTTNNYFFDNDNDYCFWDNDCE